MSVYVDTMEADFGNMKMCHMWADSEEELFAMADKIGVQRKWVQGHKSAPKYAGVSWVHFDIAQSKKKLALKHGAIQTDMYGPVEHTARLRLKSKNLLTVLKGVGKLALLKRVREKHL